MTQAGQPGQESTVRTESRRDWLGCARDACAQGRSAFVVGVVGCDIGKGAVAGMATAHPDAIVFLGASTSGAMV